MITLPQEIQAARLRLVKDRPYLASAVWALQPVQKPGLETMAVDMWWRLYYDPAVTTKWTVEEISGVLYHEICHLLREHPERMKDFDPRLSNICADAEINDGLFAEGVCLPKGAITPETIGQPENLLAEEYYAALDHEQDPAQSASAQSEQQENADADADNSEAGRSQQEDESSEAGREQSASGDQTDETTHESEASNTAREGNDSASSSTADGSSQADSSHSEDGGGTTDSKDGNGSGSESGSEGEGKGGSAASSQTPPLSDQPETSSSQSGVLSQPSGSPGSGHGSGSNDASTGEQDLTPAPGAGRCGSCATGQQEPWEEGPPNEGSSPGIGRAEGELIRRDVARQIKEHCQSQGNVPGCWVRWAEEKLRPKVDWRKELASVIRRSVADIAGASDYSYRRPSRRQGQVGNGKVIFPSLRRPVPFVAVVVDTSGSISDSMLAQAIAEVSGILKSLGQREGVNVISCDAAVQDCRKVFRAEQVHPAGGGGTDMGVGLEEASKIKPLPQVCIVITDGYTDWPDYAPRGMKVIVALTGGGNSPDWAKTVRVGGNNGSNFCKG